MRGANLEDTKVKDGKLERDTGDTRQASHTAYVCGGKEKKFW